MGFTYWSLIIRELELQSLECEKSTFLIFVNPWRT
jgi:hypothetical protein